jgi:hypothetical protein
VSVLQVEPGVKRKARDGGKCWSGWGGVPTRRNDGHCRDALLPFSARATAAMSRAAKAAKARRFMTPARLYLCDTLLERLAQDFQDVAAELRQFIQQEHAVVRQRPLAGQRHLAPADQPHIRDGVMRGAKGARRDERRAITGEAGDAVDAGGIEASGRVIAGRMVVRRRASIDFPTPGDPRRRTLWSERLHPLSRSPRPSGGAESRRALVRGHTCDAPMSRLIGAPHRPD